MTSAPDGATARIATFVRSNRPAPRRAAAALASVTAAPLATMLSALALDLPPRLAVRWSADRAADTEPAVLLAALATGAGLVAVAGVGAVLAFPLCSFLAGRAMVGALAVLAWAAAGVWGSMAATTAVADDPLATSPPGAEAVLLPLVAVMVGSRLATAAYGSPAHDPAPGPPAPDLPRARPSEAEPPQWRHETMSSFFLGAVLWLALVGSALWHGVMVAALVCWFAGLMTVPLVRLRLDVDQRGVGLGVWGLRPVAVLPWSRLVEAHAVRLRPLQWGGWGFRVIPARTGAVLRKGPGLVLTLTDGRRLGVTLDDPLTPAGLINTHLDRLRATTTEAAS